MSTLHALLTVIHTVTQDPGVARYCRDSQAQISDGDRGTLETAMYDLGDRYAIEAMTFLEEHPGGHDQTIGPVAMIMIDTTTGVASLLREVGFDALAPERDHVMWAVGRAATAVLVWARITLGLDEADRMFATAQARLTAVEGV